MHGRADVCGGVRAAASGSVGAASRRRVACLHLYIQISMTKSDAPPRFFFKKRQFFCFLPHFGPKSGQNRAHRPLTDNGCRSADTRKKRPGAGRSCQQNSRKWGLKTACKIHRQQRRPQISPPRGLAKTAVSTTRSAISANAEGAPPGAPPLCRPPSPQNGAKAGAKTAAKSVETAATIVETTSTTEKIIAATEKNIAAPVATTASTPMAAPLSAAF